MSKALWLLLTVACFCSVGFTQTNLKGTKTMNVKKITPVLYANELEPCVRFWTERFGFQKTVEVPDDGRLGFVILQKDNVELMYQSFASARKDAPGVAADIEGGRTFLYVEVANLEPFMAATKDANVVLPLRTTFYGAKEIGLKDPAGHVVVFAEMGQAQ
ncbi:MAG TPA: VOC family protein [Terriglobales bacterium]|nr:VOC family protein [Terriglobales bacterium]